MAFGNVLGPDRKMLKSRSGETVKLMDLLDEAIVRAAAAVAEKNPDLRRRGSERRWPRTVGIGAVKYADLSNDRIKDYVFDWDRMLSFDGNTAPYLQYAHARIRSIFRRSELDADLVPFGGADARPSRRNGRSPWRSWGSTPRCSRCSTAYAPHKLCTYLFELASTFTGFYEACPVLKAADDVDPIEPAGPRAISPPACWLAGLGLLGIDAPDQM